MSTNDSDQTKLAAARAFIKDGKRDLARSILETMPENKKARSWLKKLGKGKSAPAKKAASKPRLPLIILVVLVGMVIGVGGGILLSSGGGEELPSTVPAVVVADATPSVVALAETTPDIEPTLIPTPEDTPMPEANPAETTPELTVEPVVEVTPDLTGEDVEPPPLPEFDPSTESIVLDSETVGLTANYQEYGFPDGFYNVTVTTDGAFRLDIDALDGMCTNGIDGMLNVEPGEAEAGMTVPFGSAGCVANMIVANTDSAWRLVFQQTALVATSQEEVFTYDSEQEGLDASIGPLALPSGYYEVTVTTSGFITVNFQEMEGRCDVSIFGLFNLVAGDANEGETTEILSRDCVGMLLVNNATADWTLTFEKVSDLEEGD
jgi:hypothetical protein